MHFLIFYVLFHDKTNSDYLRPALWALSLQCVHSFMFALDKICMTFAMRKQNGENKHKQLFRSKMTVVFCYWENWYYRKNFWWHKLNPNISFLVYWTYTLLLLLMSWFVDDISDCINEGNLHAAAVGKQMIPEFLIWWHGSWVICHKHFTTVNISEVEYCVISGI